MARICGTLSNSGFNIEIIGRKRKTSIPLSQNKYKQTRLNCIFEKGKLFYLEYNIRLFFYLLFKKCNIISSVDLDTLFACALVSKIRSRKLVFDAHEYFTEVPEVSERKFVKQIWETFAKLCIPHTHAAYTVSESLAEIFTEKYHKKFEVVRNVPLRSSSSFLHPLIPSSSSKIILYQGDLNEGRGLEQMIEAMKEIDAEFHIAGDGLLKDKLVKLASDMHLEYKIIFRGYITPDELRDLTNKAYVGINLLVNKGLSYYYSLANKFFDYIQSGIPQVCAPFPEYEKINSEYNIALLCGCDVDRIVSAINTLLNDATLYQRMKTSCNEAAENLNWEKEEQKLLNIYRNV